MDANGLRFWLLADAAHWPSRAHTAWHAECGTLRLASERRLAAPVDGAAFTAANAALEAIPRALDIHDGVARWDGSAGAIVVRSHLPGDAVLLPLPATPSDLAVAPNGVLYIALPDRVYLHDLRGRWADEAVQLAGFAPWRIEADTHGVWVLERAGRLARLTGTPMPLTAPQRDDYAPGVFRPDPENGCPPALRLLPAVTWPVGERPVALAWHPDRGLALLSWFGDGEARLRRLDAGTGRLTEPLALADGRYAYALAWLDAERIAVRMPGRRDAPAFDATAGASSALPLGEVYPIAREATEAPFAHRLSGPPRYPLGEGAERLLPLSIRNLARRGSAASYAVSGDGLRAHLLDSANATAVWHRLYAEASIPRGTGFVVWLAATDEAEPPAEGDAGAWHAHGFGRDITALAPVAMGPHVPRASWERAPSELPNHPGLGPWTPERERRGLFTVLIQNAGARVRRLVGRYLWVRVDLYGDGRSGPDIAALRAYSSRFDYADHYLARVYREVVYGAAADSPGELVHRLDTEHAAALDTGGSLPPALVSALEASGAEAKLPAVRVEQPGQRWLLTDQAGGSAWRLVRETIRRDSGATEESIGIYRPRATRADFLSRFLANFEGVLTPLEDRIANAHLLTAPAVAPEANLEWLGGWMGVVFEPILPADRRREWLRAAPALARWHGTRRGLALALDIVTGGGVRGGEIVLLEHFRLRRLLATLLGVDLAEDTDPLLPGLHQSGNSIVGDTLVLSDNETVELLALFREEVATATENASVLEFFSRLAHRATVLVHQSVTPQDLDLIRRIAELESPAHVAVDVATATWPLLVGIASLVGVDTYLGPPQPPRPARVAVSTMGAGDFVLGPVALDPRMSGAAATAPQTLLPTADAGRDFIATVGESFDLDGSASRAAPGRNITNYIWRQLPPLS
jgi:phage tail-like protein